MVVDETGDKMSKVKGNTLDPLDLIHGAEFEAVVKKTLPDAPLEEALAKFKKAYPSTAQMGAHFAAYGADALRFTLCSYSPQAKRIALSPARIDGYRRFCNKIYNATRFALTYVENETPSGNPPEAPALLPNRWILSRLAAAVTASTKNIDEFRLDEGSGALYHFFWDELCDWYLEITKPVFASGSDAEKAETRATLSHVLESALRALHPYMPFITEELWQKLPRPAGRPISVALAPYPTAEDGREDADAERRMNVVMGAIGAARSVRSEHGLDRTDKVPLELRAADPAVRELLEQQRVMIERLVITDSFKIEAPGGERPRGTVVSVAGDVEVLVGLLGLVDGKKEKERVERMLKKLRKDIEEMEKRLANPKFVESAPPEVVAEAREQLAQLKRQEAHLVDALKLADELG
jgi:valyl-tRNA synthetase